MTKAVEVTECCVTGSPPRLLTTYLSTFGTEIRNGTEETLQELIVVLPVLTESDTNKYR